MIPRDTDIEAQRVQTGLLRAMSFQQRLELVRELTLAVQHLAFAELRRRHPGVPDDDIWLKLAVRRLGRDVVRQVYGRDIDPA